MGVALLVAILLQAAPAWSANPSVGASDSDTTLTDPQDFTLTNVQAGSTLVFLSFVTGSGCAASVSVSSDQDGAFTPGWALTPGGADTTRCSIGQYLPSASAGTHVVTVDWGTGFANGGGAVLEIQNPNATPTVATNVGTNETTQSVTSGSLSNLPWLSVGALRARTSANPAINVGSGFTQVIEVESTTLAGGSIEYQLFATPTTSVTTDWTTPGATIASWAVGHFLFPGTATSNAARAMHLYRMRQ